MSRIETLGEFEQMVLLAIIHLTDELDGVYGVPIVEEIERRDWAARGSGCSTAP